MIALALALAVQLSGSPQDTSITRVESLLAAGDVRQSLKLATKIVQQRPRDPAAHMLLGRVNYARPVVGRFPALEEFRTAARLAPDDPEPLYWQMKVGFYLRSDDGESVAREALLALFAVTPSYLDAWERFRDVYRNRDTWRRAERALARHGEQPVALEHRAELLIALEQGARADSLLAIVTAQRAAGVPTYLLRAEASFLAGHAGAGFAWHDSALAHADNDPADALWDEAWLIASPDEVERHESAPPEERKVFYQRFWGQRDPNLLTPENERLAEHYARRAEVRRTYRLLHPQRTVYHSKLARALQAFDDRREAGDFLAPFPAAGRGRLIPGPSWEFRMMDQFYTSLNSQALQDTAMPLAFRAGATAQGLVYLRHGKPEQQAICVSDLQHGWQLPSDVTCTSYRDVESWLYWTPAGPMSVRFDKGERFSPSSGEQLHNTFMLLNTDRSTLPAPLVARAWTAMFKSGDLGLTDVYYRAKGDSIAVVIWNSGGEPLRVSGGDAGLLLTTVPPGPYDLGIDIDSAGVLGRIRRPLVVPMFSLAELDLSSLVLAPIARDGELLNREEALRGMPADLSFHAGSPLAAYLELYGLGTGGDNRSRYRVRYTFAPLKSTFARMFGGSGRPVVFEFERVAEFSTASERLVIEPDKLPAGRYRVTVSVTDLTRNVKSESVALDIIMH
jgi:hypothetical protein